MRSLTIAVGLIAGVLILFGKPSSVRAQTPVPSVAVVKQVLKLSRNQWIQFRNYNGRQLVYFTLFVTYKCGLKEIRYSVNSEDLDKQFPLAECVPFVPYNIGPNDKVYLTFEPGTAKTVSVQLVFDDDTKSVVRTFKPCKVAGDVTCGVPVKLP